MQIGKCYHGVVLLLKIECSVLQSVVSNKKISTTSLMQAKLSSINKRIKRIYNATGKRWQCNVIK